MENEQNKEKDVVTVNNDVIEAMNNPKKFALMKQQRIQQYKEECKYLRAEVEYLELMARRAEAMAKLDYYTHKEVTPKTEVKEEANDNARVENNTTTENK